MEAKDLSNPREQDQTPDFLKSPKETEDFGGHANEPDTKENNLDLSNQSQTGAATDNSDLETGPSADDDVGTDE